MLGTQKNLPKKYPEKGNQGSRSSFELIYNFDFSFRDTFWVPSIAFDPNPEEIPRTESFWSPVFHSATTEVVHQSLFFFLLKFVYKNPNFQTLQKKKNASAVSGEDINKCARLFNQYEHRIVLYVESEIYTNEYAVQKKKIHKWVWIYNLAKYEIL